MNATNDVKCVYWQPERYVPRCVLFRGLNYWSHFFTCSNSWSDKDVSTIRIGNDVECRATHLTSFAVLVDTQGSSPSSTSVGTVIVISCYRAVLLTTIYFSLSLLSATLVVVYQYFHYFLQCLQSYTGGMYIATVFIQIKVGLI